MTTALVGGGPAFEALLLSRGEIAALMEPGDWLAAAEAAFQAAADGLDAAPAPMTLIGKGGAFHAKGAAIEYGGRLFVALKLNGNFPANPALRGLPTIQGAILFCDGETGSLLAVMDSAEVTLRRTAAASALAARHLARPESSNLFICGCGEQGAAHLAALQDILPLRHVYAFDRLPERARGFVRQHAAAALTVDAAPDFEAARRCDVVVTCTTSTLAFLDHSSVGPGTFIAAVGADSPGKSEITPDLMAHALVVTDRLDQCEVMGDLHHAVAAGAMTRGDAHGELAEVVVGRIPGRTSPDQVTLFDSTGIGLQDAAAAAILYTRASRAPAMRSIALAAA
jgi:alanine dehydrogenase